MESIDTQHFPLKLFRDNYLLLSFLYSSLRSSSYPLILRAYRNIGKPYTMAWQIPLLLYLFLFVKFYIPATLVFVV